MRVQVVLGVTLPTPGNEAICVCVHVHDNGFLLRGGGGGLHSFMICENRLH